MATLFNQQIQTENLHQTTIPKTFKRFPKKLGLYFESNSIIFHDLDHKMFKEAFNKLNLYHSLHKWNCDRIMKMDIYENLNMEDEAIKLMTQFLRKISPNLTKLRIMISYCGSLTEKAVQYLCQISRNFPKLKELKLIFAEFTLKGKSFERLGYEISREIRHLESFRLYFEAPNMIEYEDMKMFFLGVRKGFSGLKRLRLDFYDTGLNIETIEFIAREISKNLKGLQEFTLEIQDYDIKPESLRHIFETLVFLPKFDLIVNQQKIISTEQSSGE